MERIRESEAIAEPVDARRFNEVMGSNRFRLAESRREERCWIWGPVRALWLSR
jgi:hypothetical protein